MKLVKSIFKYLGFFLFGAFFCAVVGLTGISYYTIEQLTKAVTPEPPVGKKTSAVKATKTLSSSEDSKTRTDDAVNPNLKDLTRIGVNYVEELGQFDQLATELSLKSMPSLCTTLCNPIRMDRERLSNERTSYLTAYYKQEGARALEDPLFRLRLEEIGFLSELFPASLRSVLAQIEQTAKNSEQKTNKMTLAIKLELAVLKEISSFGLRWDALKQDTHKLKLVRDLVRSCERGTPRNKVISECRSQLEGI
ncbi:hypothetical protein [Bdellovibrio sp.]|uniref:hypothetical protein n=1 Tax=Bdellovibrio sp. TaxID=28201 RepID=UPI0039E5C9AB